MQNRLSIAGDAHLSGSNFSKTFRFVWSRMILMFMKPPRSSRLALNWDMSQPHTRAACRESSSVSK